MDEKNDAGRNGGGEDIYETLRARLDSFPMGAPKAKELDEILRMLFTEEEAALGAKLQPFPEPLGDIAKRIGESAEGIQPLLDGMADKGCVLHLDKDGTARYSLLPLVPGIFELQFMKGETTPDKKRFAELFDSYYHNGWGKATLGHKQSVVRVIPIEKLIPAVSEVLPYEKVSQLIESTTARALTNCYCRHEMELLGKSCGKPKEVCMAFGPFAEFMIKRGFGREATKEEMLQALDACEEAGLVHLSDNVQERINFICNCCGCCCGFLGSITKLDIETGVASSRYVVVNDEDLCTGCGVCVDRCQVDAIVVDEGAGVAKLAGKHGCIGCGLCVTTCPAGSLKMETRENWRPPQKTFRDVMMGIAAERMGAKG